MAENKTIEEQIIEFVTPMRAWVQQDGGDFTFKSFDKETGIVVFETAGHCVGCLNYDQTYTYGLTDALLNKFPGVVKQVTFQPKKVL